MAPHLRSPMVTTCHQHFWSISPGRLAHPHTWERSEPPRLLQTTLALHGILEERTLQQRCSFLAVDFMIKRGRLLRAILHIMMWRSHGKSVLYCWRDHWFPDLIATVIATSICKLDDHPLLLLNIPAGLGTCENPSIGGHFWTGTPSSLACNQNPGTPFRSFLVSSPYSYILSSSIKHPQVNQASSWVGF